MAKTKKFVSMLAVLMGLTFGIMTAIHAEEKEPATSESEESLSSQESQQEKSNTEEGMEIGTQSRTPEKVLGEEEQTDQPSESEPPVPAEGD